MCRTRALRTPLSRPRAGARRLHRVRSGSMVPRMLTKEQVLAGLRVHVEEMGKCSARECHWALLQLVAMTPDICAAMEAADGWTSEQRYADWCDAWLRTPDLNGPERYKQRCALLHQGLTVTHKDKTGRPLRYDRFTYSYGTAAHFRVDGRTLHLNVDQAHKEMLAAVTAWAEEVSRAQNLNVKANLGRMPVVELAESLVAVPLPQMIRGEGMLPVPNPSQWDEGATLHLPTTTATTK
jgi:hypothetical protein